MPSYVYADPSPDTGDMVSFQPTCTTMQAQDDLANLFSRNLTLNPEIAAQQVPFSPPKSADEPGKPFPNPNPNLPNPPASAPIVYSISQHYHHSTHLARQQAQDEVPQPELQRPASEPPQSEYEHVLRAHGIDPSALSTSQLQLFRMVDQPQQGQLIELWRICPPVDLTDNPALSLQSTTFEQEVQLARLRVERQSLRNQQRGGCGMTDNSQMQSLDGRWGGHDDSMVSEPYMSSGYEELMRREYERQSAASQLLERSREAHSHFDVSGGGPTYTSATDPVYKGLGLTLEERQMQMQMENQYGAFELSRSQAGGDSVSMDLW